MPSGGSYREKVPGWSDVLSSDIRHCGFRAGSGAIGGRIRAASFALKDLAGTTYSLADYRDKQPVLLFFWTTWCPYCLTKLRLMNSEYTALEKDGIALLAVNAGERRSSVERLVRNYGIRYTVLLDESSAATESYRYSRRAHVHTDRRPGLDPV